MRKKRSPELDIMQKRWMNDVNDLESITTDRKKSKESIVAKSVRRGKIQAAKDKLKN